MTTLSMHCLWVPPSFGGRFTEAHTGLRLGIRWQRHVYDGQDNYRDVEFVRVTVDPSTRQGPALVNLVSKVPSDWLQHGELVEILEGFKVVAIGILSDQLSYENKRDAPRSPMPP